MTVLLMLLIGWVALLPAMVVGGLYLSSTLLGRRREALGTYDDLFSDDAVADDIGAVIPPTVNAIGAVIPTTDDAIAHDRRVHAVRVS